MSRLSSQLRPCHSAARFVMITTVIAVCVVAAGDAFGCPNCKDAVNTSDPDGLNVARGYFYSILIMLAMPCTLISSFGIYVWREMQRQKRAGLTGGEQAGDGSLLVAHGGPHDCSSSEPITLPHS